MRNKRVNLFTICVVILCILSALFGLLLKLQYILVVSGESMLNTLQDGDLVFALPQSTYDYNDIVIVNADEKDCLLIKRVVAKGNDSIAVSSTGKVTLNGEEIDEPFAVCAELDNIKAYTETVVEPNYYFCLGDNRMHSADSRIYGAFSQREMVSKVYFNITDYTIYFKKVEKLYF